MGNNLWIYTINKKYIFSDENTDHSHENAELWDALDDLNMTISKLHLNTVLYVCMYLPHRKIQKISIRVIQSYIVKFQS